MLGIGAPLIVGILFLYLSGRSIVAHAIAMVIASVLWSILIVVSDGQIFLSEVTFAIRLGLFIAIVTNIALVPTAVYWLVKRTRMPGSFVIMWTVWGRYYGPKPST